METAGTLEMFYCGRIGYKEAWDVQKMLVKEIDRMERPPILLLLEHPPTYTIGSDRHPEHLLWTKEQLAEKGIELFEIDRGGDITYHGPGQLVGYPLIYLDAEGLDLHDYLRRLEQVIIDCLAEYGVAAGRKPKYTGVWVGDEKIAAIGVKFNKCRHRRGFVTSHGFALNVKKGIDGFAGIIPCGITEFGVTSLENITSQTHEVHELAERIAPHFTRLFRFEPVSLAWSPGLPY